MRVPHFPIPGSSSDAILQALPVALYTLDTDGKITFFNKAAAELWRSLPENGKDPLASVCSLYWPDGTKLPYSACPMMQGLRNGEPLRDIELVAERADGTRLHIMVLCNASF